MQHTHQYCTLFDRRYIARAVALYRSLERCEDDFLLRAVCMDRDSRELVTRLALPRVRGVAIEEVERADPALRAVRSSRATWEYCWTCTPAICLHFLNAESDLELLTYLDADLYFSSSPDSLFAELGDDSILLIPHRASVETERAVGTYNVGWLTFRNDDRGRAALEWWRERCLEWCYERIEPRRFGDQKYLDDFPTRFTGVRVSRQGAANLAPWNEPHHVISDPNHGNPPLVDGAPLMFFHHAGLRLYRTTPIVELLARWTEMLRVVGGPVNVAYALAWEPSSVAFRRLWDEYVAALGGALGELAMVNAPAGLFLDTPHLRFAWRQLARQRLPAFWTKTYRRLPIQTRHRISRWFGSL